MNHNQSEPFTRFRPCIDLHQGRVKQIVGGSLSDDDHQRLVENYVSPYDADHYASLYARDRLSGGHVIKLGPGNDEAALRALQAYPGGLQVGGGINDTNAKVWLDAGASHIIVTSFLFEKQAKFCFERLQSLAHAVGRQRIVVDLSCRRDPSTPSWRVAMNRWQTLTDLPLTSAVLDRLLPFTDEFLIHAADVEGLRQGIDSDLVAMLGDWGKCPVTYAGGVAELNDLQLIQQLSHGCVDVTVGSGLDLFGGTIEYQQLVEWNRRGQTPFSDPSHD